MTVTEDDLERILAAVETIEASLAVLAENSRYLGKGAKMIGRLATWSNVGL